MIHPNGPKFSSDLVGLIGIFNYRAPVRPRRTRLGLAYQWAIGPAGTATCACWASYSVQPAGAGPSANG